MASLKTLILIVSISVVIVSCTKEETPAPLPPPVKPVVEQINQPPARTTIAKNTEKIAQDLKSLDYIAGQGTGQTDCASICKKVSDCLKNKASNIFSTYCEQKCPSFPDKLKNAISGLNECSKIAYNYHRFNCENTCNLIAKANNGNIPKEIGGTIESCIAECMIGINTAEKLINTANCFISKNSTDGLQECFSLTKETRPPTDIQDLMK